MLLLSTVGKKKAQNFNVSEIFETAKRTAKELSKEIKKGTTEYIELELHVLYIGDFAESTGFFQWPFAGPGHVTYPPLNLRP